MTSIRPAQTSDLPFLWEMLFEAAYWRPEAPRPPFEEGLARPDLEKLLAGWGREGDAGVIAHEGPAPVGAAWYRRWTEDDHSYGFVAPEIPELAIGVVGAYRRRGVGRALLKALIDQGRQSDIPALSLSVERDNPAARLYRDLGFIEHADVGNAWTLLLRFET